MKKVLISASLLIGLMSCAVPIENYKGGVICEKYAHHNTVTIKYNDGGRYRFKTINLLEYDYERYIVGDTIK